MTSTVIDTRLEELRAQGYTIVRKALAGDMVAQGLQLIEDLHAQHEFIEFAGGTLVPYLCHKSAWFVRPFEQPVLEEIFKRVLNDPDYGTIPSEQPNYIIGELAARSNGPGGLKLHYDCTRALTGPKALQLTATIALEDRDEAQGCTIMIPGSHLDGQEHSDPSLDPERAVSVPLRAGDALIWDARIKHGAHPRRSQEKGWLLIAGLQLWALKQRSDLTTALPERIYRRLTPKQKALLGFCSIPPYDTSGAPYMGGVHLSNKGYEYLNGLKRDQWPRL